MTTTDTPVASEAERVISWRLYVLLKIGYPQDLAEGIANSDADLHQAEHLMLHGCAPEIAAAILI